MKLAKYSQSFLSRAYLLYLGLIIAISAFALEYEHLCFLKFIITARKRQFLLIMCFINVAVEFRNVEPVDFDLEGFR